MSFQPTMEQIRAEKILAHVTLKGLPGIHLVTHPATDNSARIGIAKRLLKAYNKAAGEEPRSPMRPKAADLWTDVVRTAFAKLLKILEAGDPAALSRYLMNFGQEYSPYGGFTFSVDGYNHRDQNVHSVAISYYDKLICLAEAVGVLPLENPEQGKWDENLRADMGHVIAALEKEIGIQIAPPLGVVPVTGVETSGGVFHYRHINGLYAAWRMKSLTPVDNAICEFGGGNGIAAYYAWRMGIKNYTIFDLPIVNLFAGHFLLNALGEDAVTLHGEDARPEAIALRPYWKCLDYGQRAFHLAINQDSFPEIDADLVAQYLCVIASTTERYFLSINQEAQAVMADTTQLNVQALVKSNGRFKRLYRSLYWIRQGYLEELYEIQSDRDDTKTK